MSTPTPSNCPMRPPAGSLPPRWPLERVLFALAGSVTLLSAGLAALVSPWFLVLSALVGLNQWLYVLAGACPASLVLRHLFALPSMIYPAPKPRRRATRAVESERDR
jgi:hypothetical protein